MPLAVAALVAMLLVPQIATLAFLFLLYINAPVVLVNLHGLPFIVGAAFIGLLGIPLASLIIRRESLIIPPTVTLIILYILVMAMSSLVARHFVPAWATLLIHIQEGLVPALLLVNFIRTPAMLRAAIWALLLAGLLMGALSIHQELTGSYDSSYGGFARIEGRGISTGVDEFGAIERRPRLAGPIGEKNRYAQVMLVLIPLAVGMLLNERGRVLKLLAAAAGFFTFSAVLLTFSRGAAVALLALVVAALALRVIRLRSAVPLVALALVAVLVVAPDFFARTATLTETTAALTEGRDTTDLSVLGRLTLDLAAVRMFVEHPILGVGIANFLELSVDYANPLGMRHFSSPVPAHNHYLQIAAETGLLGIATFLGLLGYLLSQLWRCRLDALAFRRFEHARTAAALLFALLAYLVSAVFLHSSYERYFWVLIALCAATIFVVRNDLPERNAAPP